MQVVFNAINAVRKEIIITIPAEEVQKSWEKYLRKAGRDAEVPGFRKGKAPLQMVERKYGDTMREYFLKDSVHDFFEAAAQEHDINYLLYPEVKDVQWEKDQDMVITVEVEHEPVLEFKQIEGLSVPYTPISLDDEVAKYLEELRNNNGRITDVEEAIENDHVEVELTILIGEEHHAVTAMLYAGDYPERRALPELIGKRIGDTFEVEMDGMMLKLITKNAKLHLDNDTDYPVQVMVNTIARMTYPEINDDFARDLEFEDMDVMAAKIADDLRLVNEHKNMDAMNYALIGKLYVDNQFDLPMNTIAYLAGQEAEKNPHPEYRKYLEYQYKMQISQEMVTMYVLNNLRNQVEMEVTDEMLEEYITHEAILADHTVQAYKEKNKEELASPEYADGVKNYFILRKLASTASFFVPEPEEHHSEHIEDAEMIEDAEIISDSTPE